MSIDQGAMHDMERFLDGEESHGADSAADNAHYLTIENGFGTFTFDRDNALTLPRGLLGFSEETEFALAVLPNPALAEFNLLQSLTKAELSFLVVPLSLDNDMIATEDLSGALAELSIAAEDAAILLIVTLREDLEGGVSATVNLRAPVLVDTRGQTAYQYVLHKDGYAIRHPLTKAA